MAKSKVIKDMRQADKALKELEKELKKLDKLDAYIGVPENKAGRVDGNSNANIAALAEFGSVKNNVPERRPFTKTFLKNKDIYTDDLAKIIENVTSGNYSAEHGYNLLGAKASGDVKTTIQDGLTPELSDKTIALRKNNSDKPFIDTGEFIQSITWVVK